jgi:ATP-dependent Lon protease
MLKSVNDTGCLPILPLPSCCEPQTPSLWLLTPASIKLFDAVVSSNRIIDWSLPAIPELENPGRMSIFFWTWRLSPPFRTTDGTIRILIQESVVFRLANSTTVEPIWWAKSHTAPEWKWKSEIEALARNARDPFELIAKRNHLFHASWLISITISQILFKPLTPSRILNEWIGRCPAILELTRRRQITNCFHPCRESKYWILDKRFRMKPPEIEKVQRDYFLREQLKPSKRTRWEDEQTETWWTSQKTWRWASTEGTLKQANREHTPSDSPAAEYVSFEPI